MATSLRRHLILALITSLLCFAVEAQPVFIPDAQLRIALNEWVPSAVDGSGFLDPDNPDVLAQTDWELLVRWSPADLTGIDALTGLANLALTSQCDPSGTGTWVPCSTNTIVVPAWPPSLVWLTIEAGAYSGIPPFPASLQNITIGLAEGIASMPPLPAGLMSYRHQASNDLMAFPELPTGLQALSLNAVPGLQFPELPADLVSLTLEGAAGVTLPAIPANLGFLALSTFSETAVVSEWPSSLEHILLEYWPNLSLLPASWPPNLSYLGISNQPVDQIPVPLPGNLQSLALQDLPITSIPALPPALDYLLIYGLTEVNCLPTLPDWITYLAIDGFGSNASGFTCLPNLPFAADIIWNTVVYTSWDTELLCSALNSPCSNANPVAAGMVFVDDNGNGVLDDGEPGYPGVSIHVQPINVTYGTSTAGAYTIPLPPGDYTLSATTTIPWVQSIAPPAYDVSLWDPLDPSLGNDFAVTLFADLFDLSISLAMPLAKPGVLTNGYITYKNLGDGPMDGTVNLTLAAVCQYILGFPAASASAFNTASWNFSALQPGEVRQINFRFVTSESVSAGFVLDSYAEIQPLVGDATPGNNSSNCLTEVVASYDPNDKRV